MEETLRAVGQLLIQALPTFFLVLLLHFYLKRVFFKPLSQVLAERDEATEGARRKAAEALDHASAQAASYEQQLRVARNEIYREQEAQRNAWLDEQAAQVAHARRNAETAVQGAKQQLATQAEEAKRNLASDTQALADHITKVILQGKAA